MRKRCQKEDAESAVHFSNTTICDDAGEAPKPAVSQTCQEVQSKCSVFGGQDDTQT